MAGRAGVLWPADHLHSAGAYLASRVAALPKVNPVGVLAPLAKHRQATAPWSGRLKSAVASGNAVAAVTLPVKGTNTKLP